MNRSPILKALSSIRRSGARTLLMGGQACVFYGAAEFSRDLDLLILAGADNLARLASALDELAAQPVAVPPMDAGHLLRGHAAHFRCGREDVAGLRIDIMAALRGVAGFEELWLRLVPFGMIQRSSPDAAAVEFWLRELRTPELLVEAAAAYPERANPLASERPALAAALRGSVERVRELLEAEERDERRKDREYWAPLKRELEQLRLARSKEPP